MDISFVLSYEVETISFACREMMSMGKPVIVSDYAGLVENITHRKDGWIIPRQDLQALKTCLMEIMHNLNKLEDMSVQARNKAVNEFSHNKFVAETLKVYESVANSPPPGALFARGEGAQRAGEGV